MTGFSAKEIKHVNIKIVMLIKVLVISDIF